jgi:plastocyanin
MNLLRLIAPALLTITAIATLPGSVAASAAPMPAATVHVSNFTFGPQKLSVKAGQAVTWVNDDDIPHTIASTGLLFKSKVLDTGDTFSFTFTRPGAYAYYCSLHPHMTGTIIVTA